MVVHDRHVAHDGETRRVQRHDDHRMALVAGRIGALVADPHDDGELAVGMQRAGGEPLAAVDHVLIALAADGGADIGGIGRCHIGLGHREAGADTAVEQGLQPALVLLGRGKQVQQLGVAGIGRIAVENLGRPVDPADDLGQRAVLHIAHAGAGLIVTQAGQEKVPQTGLARQLLERLDHLGRVSARSRYALVVVVAGHHMALHELAQRALHLLRVLGVLEVQERLL